MNNSAEKLPGNPPNVSTAPPNVPLPAPTDQSQNRTDAVDQRLKVFVKLKPFPAGVKLTRQQILLYQVINPVIIVNLADVPQDITKNVDVVGKKFWFNEAFGNDIKQIEVFERVVKPQIDHFFVGENSTFMAYGSATSGKTHTLDGYPTDLGLIPQALDLIFTQIKPLSNPNYKPKNGYLEVLSPITRIQEMELKKKVLDAVSQGRAKNPFLEVLRKVQGGLNLPGSIFATEDEIWVSFLEIRNEKHYDLLSSGYLARQVPLRSESGPQGVVFQGLTHLNIVSAAEGRDALAVGRRNLRKLEGILNRRVSKSHCIFTINLLRYTEANRPESVRMSKMSFCDLAGHQESPVLDMSLLALVKSLRAHHEAKTHSRITESFCSSSLTKLFEASLKGQENLSVITHIDPNPGVYKETHEALHFTAIGSEILTKIRTIMFPDVNTIFGNIMVHGKEDPDWTTDLRPEFAGQLASEFQHGIAAYQALDHKLNITINTIRSKKVSNMMEKMAQYYQANVGLPPDERDQASLEKTQLMFEALQDELETIEQDLSEAREEWNAINAELPPEDNLKNFKGLNPRILLMEKQMEIQNERDKNKNLTSLLEEARVEILSALHDICHVRQHRLGLTERKSLALKLLLSMDQMLGDHTVKQLQKQLVERAMVKKQLDRATEERKIVQTRYEQLKIGPSESANLSKDNVTKNSGEPRTPAEVPNDQIKAQALEVPKSEESWNRIELSPRRASDIHLEIMKDLGVLREKFVENSGKIDHRESKAEKSVAMETSPVEEMPHVDDNQSEESTDLLPSMGPAVHENSSETSELQNSSQTSEFFKNPSGAAETCSNVETQEPVLEKMETTAGEDVFSNSKISPASENLTTIANGPTPPSIVEDSSIGDSNFKNHKIWDDSPPPSSEGLLDQMEIAAVEDVFSHPGGSPCSEHSIRTHPGSSSPPNLDDCTFGDLKLRNNHGNSWDSSRKSYSSSFSGSIDLEPLVLETSDLNGLAIKTESQDSNDSLKDEHVEQGSPVSETKIKPESDSDYEPDQARSGRGRPRGRGGRSQARTPQNQTIGPVRRNRRSIPQVPYTVPDFDSTSLRRSSRNKRSFNRFASPITSGKEHMKIKSIDCDICFESVLHQPRYHCTVCQNGDFDLCMKCFKKIGHEHSLEEGILMLVKGHVIEIE